VKKKYYEVKVGHGWFNGYMRETDVISCVDSGMWKWHILIAEKMIEETNKIIERERERVPIKNKTSLGYLYAYDGDGIDISPRMEYHRGTVQRGMAQTIKTSCDVGVIEFESALERND